MILLIDWLGVGFRDSKDFVDGVDDTICGVLVQFLQKYHHGKAVNTNTELKLNALH